MTKTLLNVIPNFQSSDKIRWCYHSSESTVQYVTVVLFVMLYKVVPPYECVNLNSKLLSSIHLNGHTLGFHYHTHRLPRCMLYKLVLRFQSGWNNQVWPSTESYKAVLSCGIVYYSVQGVVNFWVSEWNLEVWPFRWKLLRSSFLWYSVYIMLYKVVLTFESMGQNLYCDHSNESYWALLSCGTVYYVVQGGSNFWVCGWNPKVWPFKLKLLSSTFLW